MHTTRTLWRWLAALLAVSLVAAACGGDDGGSGDGGGGDGGSDTTEAAADLPDCPVDALDTVDGKVQVVVWHTYVAKTLDTLTELTDEYNASQDKVEVRLESQGQDYETLLRKVTEAIPTGDLPAVILVDDPATQFMADSGIVLPAQACFEAAGISLDGFLDTAVAYYTVDGALQPGVLNIGNTLLYYNRKHFEDAGLDPDDPPETLDEIRSAAEAIKAAGVSDKPLVMSLQPFLIEFWLTGAGAPVVNNDNGRSDLASEGAMANDTALELYQWIKGMYDDGLLNAIPDTEGNVDHFFAIGLGQSSMLPDTSSAATSVAAFLKGEDVSGVDGAPEVDTEGLDIDAARWPSMDAGQSTQVGGTAWYLTQDQPDEVIAGAWDWMTFMNQPEIQARWNTEGSFSPWVKAAVDDPALQEMWTTTRLGSWLQIAYEQVESIDPEWPGPLIGPYTETRDAIRSSLDRLILEGQDPQATLDEADAEITDALERYADENF